jgi:hypothetical protein
VLLPAPNGSVSRRVNNVPMRAALGRLPDTNVLQIIEWREHVASFGRESRFKSEARVEATSNNSNSEPCGACGEECGDGDRADGTTNLNG